MLMVAVSPDGSMVVSVLQEAFVRSMMSFCVVWLGGQCGGGCVACFCASFISKVRLLFCCGCVFQKGGK